MGKFTKLRLLPSLLCQKAICFCVLSIIYPVFWVWLFNIKKYHINRLSEIRKEFKIITKKLSGAPLIICPNHLTYIDSLLLVMAFSSLRGYIFKFYTFAWNFPKTEHVKDNLLYKIICYIGKCILLDLSSPLRQTQHSMQKAAYLLEQGEYLMIFPEGHRSVTGLVDNKNFAYGVGKLINEVPQTKILCVYLRGSSQKCGSNFPKQGDQFYCALKLISPKSVSSGLRASREISQNIVQTLSEMEQEYFLHYA